MACVYRPVVTKTVNGKRVKRKARYYWAKYKDAKTGRVIREALRLANGEGITDKEVATQELRNRIKRQQREAVGLADPFLDSAGLPIRTVLARYIRHLRALRRSRQHSRQTLDRIKWMIEAAGMKCLGDLSANSVCRALDKLAGQGRAPKTINDYRASMFGMCQWAIKVVRILERNPVESVPVRERKGDVRKKRRALTYDEARRLLKVAKGRALWYETAMMTGLRVNELRQLQWGDLDLDSNYPHVQLRAATTKAKREDTVALRRSLAAKLKAAKPPFARPTDRVFPTTPSRTTFRRDCDKAGIDYRPDDRGRTLDRHALRKTFITWLRQAGVDPQMTKELARHTDIRLTMDAYTDLRVFNMNAAVESLGDLDDASGALAATGTSDLLPIAPAVVPARYNAGQPMASAGTTDRSLVGVQSPSEAALGTDWQHGAQSQSIGGAGNRTRVPEHFR